MSSSLRRRPRPPGLPDRGLCAHRGASATHPENTLTALREAVRLGAQQVEFDVRRTCDGHLVLFHDATVDRTTDGAGPVSGLPLGEVRRLDAGRWKARRFAGERVPTLEEALAVLPPGRWVNVQVKDGESAALAAARVLSGQAHAGAFLTVRPEAAESVGRVFPDLPLCCSGARSDPDRYAAQALARGDLFVQFKGMLPAPPVVRHLKGAGLLVNFYRCDDPRELEALFGAGVDFPLVDDLGAMMPVAREVGHRPW